MKIQLSFIGLTTATKEELERLVHRSQTVSISLRSDERVCFVDQRNDGLAQLEKSRAYIVGLVREQDLEGACTFFRAGGNDVLIVNDRENHMAIDPGALDILLGRAVTHFSKEPPALPTLAEVEKAAITRTLQACRGQMSSSARVLGIGRSTLYRKVEAYGIRTDQIAMST